MTFGAKDKCHGGILIRSIQPIIDPNSKIIEGPCCVVDTLLKHCEVDSIVNLVKKENFKLSIFLIYDAPFTKFTLVYVTPRRLVQPSPSTTHSTLHLWTKEMKKMQKLTAITSSVHKTYLVTHTSVLKRSKRGTVVEKDSSVISVAKTPITSTPIKAFHLSSPKLI